MFGDIRLDGWF